MNHGVINAEIRSCPKCGSAMLLRQARRGVNAGGYFWGCSKFPKCKGILAAETGDVSESSFGRPAQAQRVSLKEHGVPYFVLIEGEGLGKVIASQRGTAIVEFFHSPVGTARERLEFDAGLLSELHPPNGTRCFIHDENDRWRLGRIVSWMDESPRRYQVMVEGESDPDYISVERLFVRSEIAVSDPMDVIQYGGLHNPLSAGRRKLFVAEVMKQREASQGLTSILSSHIQLHRHQIEIAQRVLRDPVQRYLLADEVGMGKSVEAGIIIRQLLLDDRNSRVLVVVPDGLIAQWESELCGKFRLHDYRNRVEIVGHSVFSKERDYSKVDLLVVDEVHNLVAKRTGSEEELATTELTLASHSVPRLLLLSATPLLHNEEIFLGMLHLLDPDLYRLDDLEEFTSRVRSKEEFALRLQSFDVGKSDWILETQAEAFQEIFPEDDVLHSLTSTLLACIDGEHEVDEQFNQLVRSIRTHLAETYRLHRRVLRTRRESPLGRDFPVRGRQYQSDQSERNWREVDDWLLDWLSEFSRRVQMGSTDSLAVTALLGLLERLQSLPSIAVSYCHYWQDSSDLGARQSAELTSEESAALEATPLRARESELLVNLTELLDAPAQDRLWVEKVVADIRSLPTGSVVFCGFDQATFEVLDSINSGSGVTAVAIGQSDSAPNSYAQALTDVRNGNIGYLLCGREAEEGLNIQFAPAVFLAHLPWDPGRIEQRIGRADRFGQGSPVSIHVLSDTDFVTAVWAEFLANGFGAFEHSIASLQHQLSSWRDKAVTTLLERGSTALRESTPEFREALLEDLGRVLRIEALESIDSESRLGEQLFASMRSVDARPNEIEEVIDDWVLWKKGEESVATLGFLSSGSGYKFRPIFSTIPLEYVRAQLEFGVVEFESGRSVPVSFAREACLDKESSVHLMRVGDPFFDGLVRLTNAVDLGQTFGFIRPNANGHSRLIADVTFRLEGDVAAVRDALGLQLQGLDDEAVIRLLDSFLPPQTQRILLDQESRCLEADLQTELEDEFDNDHDRAIVTREIPFVEAKFDVDWVVWWEEIRDASMQNVINSESFREAKRMALDKLDSVQTDLTHQLRLRQNSETSSLEISCLAGELERQRIIWDAVRLGIERMVPVAEVAGVIVLAADDFLGLGDLV